MAVTFLTNIDKDSIIKSNNLNEYEFHYYSTFSKAVSAINKKTLAGDSTENNAEVCIWLDDDAYYNIKLLKNSGTRTSEFNISKNIKLILNGYTLTHYKFSCSADLIIDGTIENSKIFKNNVTITAINLIKTTGNKLIINGGSYEIYSGEDYPYDHSVRLIEQSNTEALTNISNASFKLKGNSAIKSATIGLNLTGNCIIRDSVFDLQTTSKINFKGINNTGKLLVENCTINTIASMNEEGNSSYAIYNEKDLTINNCKIFADCPNNSVGYALSQAVRNTINGTLTINGGKYIGTHTGVSSQGHLFIDGGTFVSNAHGGLYLSGGADKQIYIKNATIGCEEYTGKYDFSAMENGYLGAFYIGGNSGDLYCNTSVYINNCNLLTLGAESAILRNTSGEHGNKLYISNTIIPPNRKIRNSDGNYLYIGLGTNISSDKLYKPDLNNYFYTDIDGYIKNYINPKIDNKLDASVFDNFNDIDYQLFKQTVEDTFSTKQDKLVVGNGINIIDNTISADTDVIATIEQLNKKENKIAGGYAIKIIEAENEGEKRTVVSVDGNQVIDRNEYNAQIQELTPTISSTLPTILVRNTEYYLGDISDSITLTFPNAAPKGDYIYINFNAISDITLTINTSNTSDIDIVPVSGTSYEIFATWNGSIWILGYNEYTVTTE